MTDTEAGTPHQHQSFRERDACPECRAAMAAARSRPATDLSGLDVERLARSLTVIWPNSSGWDAEPPWFREKAASIAAEYARLSVADGPGPEERLGRTASATRVDFSEADRAALIEQLAEADSPLGHGTPVPEEAELPSGDARIEGLCAACGHDRRCHSSGGMCDGNGTECYCVRFPDATDFARIEALAAPLHVCPACGGSGLAAALNVESIGLSAEQTAILREHLDSRQQTIAEFFGDVLMDLGLGRASGKEYPPAMTARG